MERTINFQKSEQLLEIPRKLTKEILPSLGLIQRTANALGFTIYDCIKIDAPNKVATIVRHTLHNEEEIEPFLEPLTPVERGRLWNQNVFSTALCNKALIEHHKAHAKAEYDQLLATCQQEIDGGQHRKIAHFMKANILDVIRRHEGHAQSTDGPRLYDINHLTEEIHLHYAKALSLGLPDARSPFTTELLNTLNDKNFELLLMHMEVYLADEAYAQVQGILEGLYDRTWYMLRSDNPRYSAPIEHFQNIVNKHY